MITLKLIRCHSLCSRTVLRKEIIFSGKRCNRHSDPHLFTFKRLLSASSCLRTEKPIILSASEIVQESSLNTLTDALTEPTLAELGIANTWWPSHLVERLFETIHIYTGSPWWLSIALGTFALRVVTAPLFVSSRKATIRYTNHAPMITKLRDDWMEAMQGKNLNDQMTTRKRYKDYMKEHKASPTRLMRNNIALPVVFISCMRALTEMASVPVPSMVTSSFYWISNLLEPDPYRLLPLLSGCLVGLNMFVVMRANPAITLSRTNAGLVSLLPVIAMPLFFGSWSGAFGIYLFVNSAVTSAISMALATKKVQTLLDMPTSNVGKGKKTAFMQQVSQRREKMIRKHEAREIRRMLKNEAKDRKKELKGKPPRLYEIGTEAKPKEPFVPDFQREWRPPKVNIYEQ